MSFSLPRFLRHIRPSDLEDYFEQRDIRFPVRLNWNAAPAKSHACLKAAIEALPDMQCERVFDDFERIDQLTDDIGQCSLLAVAEPDGALLRRFQSCHGRQVREEAEGRYIRAANVQRPGRPDSKRDPLYRLYRGAAGKQRRIRARRAETADPSAGHRGGNLL
jgi:hypothetical protein